MRVTTCEKPRRWARSAHVQEVWRAMGTLQPEFAWYTVAEEAEGKKLFVTVENLFLVGC